jgi:hypothetical protein
MKPGVTIWSGEWRNQIFLYPMSAMMTPKTAVMTLNTQYRITTLYAGQPIASKWW